MAQETRLLFDASDVRIRMKCPDCKIELWFEPQSDQRVPMGCPNCKTTWNIGNRESERAWNAVRVLRNALHVVAHGKEDSDMFDISMEITLQS